MIAYKLVDMPILLISIIQGDSRKPIILSVPPVGIIYSPKELPIHQQWDEHASKVSVSHLDNTFKEISQRE